MVTYGIVLITALVTAAALTPMIAWAGIHVGLLDLPGGRKRHVVAVPRLGGVAVALALAAGLAASLVADAIQGVSPVAYLIDVLPLIGAALLVFAVGLWDDIDPRTVRFKIAVELLASLIVIGAGITISRMTLLGVTYDLGWLAPLATIAWVLGVTNAFNLVDGLDGLAGGLVAIAAATCAVVLIARGESHAARLLVALLGATLGFLIYNLPPARIYLGDSGSLLAGFLLAVTAVTGRQKGATTLAAGVPLLIFALPLLETATTILRRVIAGQRLASPGLSARTRALSRVFAADAGHLHHRLARAGLTPRAAVLLFYGFAFALSAIALLTMQTP